ncbi:hypothetical protein [Actinobacillus pleuropneumoniae]|uniref:hypothetical protein n=1 Tax=Actinobacillus pleuropneumoniae TaxID=715 RepID=UPI0001E49D4C|nr:hypothetical protein [Actinobacillus pleuropneumoniae]EFM95725.1 hypothetical protein appser10_16130 [Actinobacillus pleuropneumoniae serovar 10 str. D13039]UKH33409.1 transporter [Actinobacillus pleuropneumoniae serovar 10 str. D13039]
MLLRYLFTLIISTAVGVAGGFGLSSLDTQTWKATAEFEPPKVSTLGNYYTLFSTYTFLNGGDGVSYNVIADDKGSLSLAPEICRKAEDSATLGSYNEFKRNLISTDVLVEFLTQTETVKLKAQLTHQPIVMTAQSLAEQFVFQAATKTQPFDSLSVRSANPEEAYKLLNDFIAFANQQTKQTLNAELVAKWKNLFQQIKSAADIKLGAIQQGNQIATQDWNGKLNLMRSVQPLDDQLTAFRFVKTPSVPLTPDTPNPTLWMMIGALAGLLLGMVIVSTMGLLRKKPADAEQN